MYPLWLALDMAKKYRFVELSHSLNTDSPYWHDLINDAGELGKKYGAKPGSLYANLINAFLDTCNGEAYRAKSKGEREI